MNIDFLLIVVGVAGVVILVIFEAYKFAKAHPSNPLVQQVEAKVPGSVLSAAGLAPAVTGDHLVQAVAATGQAVATAVQAVTSNISAATLAAVPADQGQRQMLQGLLGSDSKAPAAPAVPSASAQSAFDPILWGKATGEHYDAVLTAPVHFDTVIEAGSYQMSCGAGNPGDATPSISSGGQALVTGYGVRFTVAAQTPATVTITPNKNPAGVSVSLGKA